MKNGTMRRCGDIKLKDLTIKVIDVS